MTLLILLLIAHFLGDFALQSNAWVKDKKAKGIKSQGFWMHILTHAILLFLIGIFYPTAWWVLLIILIGHILIDGWKTTYLRQNHKNKLSNSSLFLIDQTLHLLLIFGAYFLYAPEFKERYWEFISSDNALWVMLGFIILGTPIATLMRVLLTPLSKQIKDDNSSLKNAGKVIGYLERFLVFIFVLLGQWGAIGFLITAKSVFRFGDLTETKNRQLTEYILIGTLLSFGIAILTGIIIKGLLSLNL